MVRPFWSTTYPPTVVDFRLPTDHEDVYREFPASPTVLLSELGKLRTLYLRMKQFDGFLAHRMKQGAFHLIYRLIKIYEYEKYLWFVQLYEHMLPEMYWQPASEGSESEHHTFDEPQLTVESANIDTSPNTCEVIVEDVVPQNININNGTLDNVENDCLYNSVEDTIEDVKITQTLAPDSVESVQLEFNPDEYLGCDVEVRDGMQFKMSDTTRISNNPIDGYILRTQEWEMIHYERLLFDQKDRVSLTLKDIGQRSDYVPMCAYLFTDPNRPMRAIWCSDRNLLSRLFQDLGIYAYFGRNFVIYEDIIRRGVEPTTDDGYHGCPSPTS